MQVWSVNLWNLTIGSPEDVWVQLFLLIAPLQFQQNFNIILYILLWRAYWHFAMCYLQAEQYRCTG